MNLVKLPNEHLHSLVYFIYHGQIVGSEGYRTLLNWIADMNVDVTRVKFFDIHDHPFNGTFAQLSLEKATKVGHIKVITLGEASMNYVMDTGVEMFFNLDDPKNEIGNIEAHNNDMSMCKDFIYRTED